MSAYFRPPRLCPHGCGVRLADYRDTFGTGICPRCQRESALTRGWAARRWCVLRGGWAGAVVVWAWDTLRGRPGQKQYTPDPWSWLLGSHPPTNVWRCERRWWGVKLVPILPE